MYKEAHILLVEDDDVDIMTIKRAFKDLKIINPLDVAKNGEEGISFLKDANTVKPGMILLDLNMPQMNGIEFLKVIKNDNALKSIPVVVFTTSNREKDTTESYNLGVAGYVVKPVAYTQFLEVLRTINLYWILCELPVPVRS